MTATGHKLTTPAHPRRSALVPTADIAHGAAYVRYVPLAEVTRPSLRQARFAQSFQKTL